jgi:NAD(P) transhydrogenase subunit beta
VIHDVEVAVGVFIGAVTFTGSIVAFLKLSARIKSAPLMLPGATGSTSARSGCSPP